MTRVGFVGLGQMDRRSRPTSSPQGTSSGPTMLPAPTETRLAVHSERASRSWLTHGGRGPEPPRRHRIDAGGLGDHPRESSA